MLIDGKTIELVREDYIGKNDKFELSSDEIQRTFDQVTLGHADIY